MRFLCIAAAILWAPACVQAGAAPAADYVHSQPDLAPQRTAMNRLAPMGGRWEGVVRLRAPEAVVLYQTCRVEFELDSTVLIVRRTLYAEETLADALLQTLTIVSYDQQRQRYDVRTYLDGSLADAAGAFLEDGRFRWIVNGGDAWTRHTISVSDRTWTETIETSADAGRNWVRARDIELARRR